MEQFLSPLWSVSRLSDYYIEFVVCLAGHTVLPGSVLQGRASCLSGIAPKDSLVRYDTTPIVTTISMQYAMSPTTDWLYVCYRLSWPLSRPRGGNWFCGQAYTQVDQYPALLIAAT